MDLCPTRCIVKLFVCTLAAAALLPAGRAQQGDRGQSPELQKPPAIAIPPSPPLPPAQALASFKVAPGFHVELVAGEPLVECPVAIAFDPDGRLWVCEMRGYMPDVDGTGEDAPVGRIVFLEDTDGDGKMDKSTVFLDGLVLPRALAFAHGGVLVAEPPHLWFCGLPGPDGRATSKTELLSDYGTPDGHPEYLPNGLLWAMDNWIYSARAKRRYRFDPAGKLVGEANPIRGQWGIAQDDVGRLFYNYNSDELRADLIPDEYFERNPDLRDPVGVNVQLIKNQVVYPARVNPGVNRGYEKNTLRSDGTLRNHTSACGPTVYRGDLFPAEFRGNAFVCEPAANLVRRDILEAHEGNLQARNAYDSTEFLASTDERFRPVNLDTGPDGALYVVDMYRGLIQHKAYLTTYLRQQTLARGLDNPLDYGCIYRVVPDGAKVGPLPKLEGQSSPALVARLSHPNGWWRDTAQRLLVERADPGTIPGLEALARDEKAEPRGRLHALWTLQGMGRLSPAVVVAVLPTADPVLRAAAIRLSEGFFGKEPALLPRVLRLADDPEPAVRLQVALSLGQVPAKETDAALASILLNAGDNPVVRDAVISGLHRRELEFLGALLIDPHWTQPGAGKAEALGGLARCVLREMVPARVEQLLQLIASQSAETSWRGDALLASLADVPGARNRKADHNRIELSRPPRVLETLAARGDAQSLQRLRQISNVLDWPGKVSTGTPAPASIPLTPAQRTLFERGKVVFEQTCAACHQTTGLGQEGLAPPLVGSPWVVGPERRLIRIALHGLTGAVEVNGKTFDMEMPPMGVLGDGDLAAILTYLRHRWGHSASPVEPARVTEVRRETASRSESWTETELLAIP